MNENGLNLMLVGRKTCTAVLGDTSRVLGVVPFVLLLILLLLVVLLLVLFFARVSTDTAASAACSFVESIPIPCGSNRRRFWIRRRVTVIGCSSDSCSVLT